MSGSHTHALYIHRHSALHRLAPHVKILTALVVVFAIVATPREAFVAFGAYAIALAVALAVARIPIRALATRYIVLVPFVLVALALLVFGADPRVDVGPISLSVQGLWDMWNIVAKATLGLTVAIVLGATTEVTDLIRGIQTLRTPAIVVGIVGFMVRYIDVVLSDLARMQTALASRGHVPHTIRSWRPYARTLGVMFVRTYERGERVYLAMESRGFTGTMPAGPQPATSGGTWLAAVLVMAAFWTVALLAWVVR